MTQLNEEAYALEHIQAELKERMLDKNLIEIETKHSIGQQLLEYPNLVGKINNEDHYYVMFAETFTPEEAYYKFGKIVSWHKIKTHLKQMQDIRVQQGQKHAQKLLDTFQHSIFTEKQLGYLRMRAEGLTLQQIADKEGTTRQAISDGILNATKKAYAKTN